VDALYQCLAVFVLQLCAVKRLEYKCLNFKSARCVFSVSELINSEKGHCLPVDSRQFRVIFSICVHLSLSILVF
jgi:hypothetical protein